jgi:hypothetical protein
LECAIVEIAGAANVADRIRAASYQHTEAVAVACRVSVDLGAFRVGPRCVATGQPPLDQSLPGGNEGGWYFRVREQNGSAIKGPVVDCDKRASGYVVGVAEVAGYVG